MQSTRSLAKLRPLSRNTFKHSSKALVTQRPRTMSLFPRYATATPYDGGFRSLFRMMDDIATNYENAMPSATSIRAFSPKFDVIEEKDAYKLHGELPGLDQKDVVSSGQKKTKYWVSERSVGEFHRSFSFPGRVDQDGVKASLKNGVLSIVVPKLAAIKHSRKVAIETAE